MANVVWNSEDANENIVLSNGDETATKLGAQGYFGIRGTVSYSAGLRYFEATVPDGNEGSTGLATSAASLSDPLGYASSEGLGLYGDGTVWMGGSAFGSSEGSVGNTRVGFLVDLTAKKLWIRASNGNWSHGGDPASGGAGIDISSLSSALFPMFTGYYDNDSSTLYSDSGTITLGLPSGATLWGDEGGSTPSARKAIRSVYWL
ncbi:hypothetical protein [Novosphingobium sp. PY1]|uniref:hypothetical protein n=1 Tax=Novosphingobium sp. PY1 TaxID=1882221 RepID=UPI001A8C1093|nr:hypothetical protein [Novosphingobium sp. PY1]GFM27158.1 SPRY domain protein [Novosphingobium sp. PY1]